MQQELDGSHEFQLRTSVKLLLRLKTVDEEIYSYLYIIQMQMKPYKQSMACTVGVQLEFSQI